MDELERADSECVILSDSDSDSDSDLLGGFSTTNLGAGLGMYGMGIKGCV